MTIGDNIQHRRKAKGMKKEELAQQLKVSRQTISKWEMNQANPEISKLVELASLFNCKIDELLSDDLKKLEEIYSDVKIVDIPAFRLGRYAMITPNPEDDLHAYLESWAKASGLEEFTRGQVQRIGWDFPFVSIEQANRFGMHGYVEGCILPEGFEPGCPGVEIYEQVPARYDCITISDPFSRAFVTIPGAYRRIMEYLSHHRFKERPDDHVLSCFEYFFQKDHQTFMTVCLSVEALV
ncbi:helix-turn-helix domain-containing protein [Ileibacterium valens]|uniref:helix-turn-helix domain-containing protein n=1 Tax=Ileibacterium valens TaxID=1862668 RepID=UPI0024B9B57E|nr:helix-turn-helix transcriptional regulator [Ileibacterium valens]